MAAHSHKRDAGDYDYFGDPVKPTGPGHLPECGAIPVYQAGDPEPVSLTAILQCAPECPHLKATLRRGRQLAKEHGW